MSFRESLDRVLYAYAITLLEQGRDKQENDVQGQDVQGQRERAMNLFAEVTQIRRELLATEPDNTTRQIALITTLSRIGEIDEAVELAQSARENISGDSTFLYHLACGYAQIAGALDASGRNENEKLRQQMIDEAVEALRGAKRAGFYRQSDLRLDPDLDPIRGSKAFEQFVENGL
ncbi:hypothetical protein Pla22_29750 [Rubripirellula amarantea]|uniref:Tetratricopeptide repeat protein n=1 Tax=Rubripirellula amarantea TaxID=2527999 RepID=A0A5C5WHF3_9BACT|nr:hypothetical protein [Rubripirellula amarantea]TWT50234.1 hypothetical protein Pla22_29750 [Rubripirellula amarantea]